MKLRETAKFADIEYFLRRFPSFKPGAGVSVDFLHDEFLAYQALEKVPVVTPLNDMEEHWKALSTVTDHNGARQFHHLALVMQKILLIPVSNAACERVFSFVRANKTDYRGSLQEKTLSSLLVLKNSMQNQQVKCHSVPLTKPLLKICKQATWKHLTAASASATITEDPIATEKDKDADTSVSDSEEDSN